VKRKKLLTCILVVVAAALAYAGLAPLQAQQKKAIAASAAKKQTAAKPAAAQKLTVLNPAISSKMANRTPISPRLETLDGKTLYLVDISWGGPEAAYSVFEEMKDWFAQNKPSVKIVIKRKAGMYIQDDPALWREIKQNGNAALVGISG
jgi:hypothetical protein